MLFIVIGGGANVVLGFCYFEWARNSQKYYDSNQPPKKIRTPFPPALSYMWPDKGGDFQKLSYGSETLWLTSGGLGEMFEGDFADTCTECAQF